MAMSTVDLIAIIGSVFGSALALGVVAMRMAARIDADRRAFQAEAAQDRRALQARPRWTGSRREWMHTGRTCSASPNGSRAWRQGRKRSNIDAPGGPG